MTREQSNQEKDITRRIREHQKSGNQEALTYWKKKLQEYKKNNNIRDYIR